MATSDLHNFHIADYVVFGAMLLISMGIGIFHACVGGKQKSTKEFLMANQNMGFLPVALSVLASFFSASTLLGTPAEIYMYGTQYWMSVFGAMCAPITGALLFGPLFFKLKVVSVFQYLEERFQSKTVRLFGAIIFLVRTTIGMGIVLFGPSTALSAVTPFPEWAVILVVGGVCTFYTTIGGLKAVMWTDVFQTLVMLAGMLAVVIKGAIDVGGLTELWDIAENGNRIEFFRFDLDPHVRHTFWALIIGIYFVWLPPYTVDQQMVQRFSSARSLKDAKLALWLNVPGMFILITLCSFTGLVMYAFYAGCDPLKTHDAANPNQLLPLFVVELFRSVPGIPGLFVACLFSGAMSSISSMLNSLSAVTWEDFLKLKFSKVSDERATFVTKCLVFLFGCLGVGMAFAVKQMGGTVLQASLTLNGAAGAPLVGLFILGACFTSSNWIGALVGGVIGFAFPMWCGIGKYIDDPQNFKLSTSIDGCNGSYLNTSVTGVIDVVGAGDLEGLQQLYGLSYIWFSAMGIIIVVVVGLLVSCATGPTHKVDDKLLLHFWQHFCLCLFPPVSAIKKEKQRLQLLEKIKTAPPLVLDAVKMPKIITLENGQIYPDLSYGVLKQTTEPPLDNTNSLSQQTDQEAPIQADTDVSQPSNASELRLTEVDGSQLSDNPEPVMTGVDESKSETVTSEVSEAKTEIITTYIEGTNAETITAGVDWAHVLDNTEITAHIDGTNTKTAPTDVDGTHVLDNAEITAYIGGTPLSDNPETIAANVNGTHVLENTEITAHVGGTPLSENAEILAANVNVTHVLDNTEITTYVNETPLSDNTDTMAEDVDGTHALENTEITPHVDGTQLSDSTGTIAEDVDGTNVPSISQSLGFSDLTSNSESSAIVGSNQNIIPQTTANKIESDAIIGTHDECQSVADNIHQETIIEEND